MKTLCMTVLGCLLTLSAAQAQDFAVATIKPAQGQVEFERDGRITVTADTVRMQDVSLNACLKWAYSVMEGQVSGPELITADHFDIVAKAEGPSTEAAMRKMMQHLLTERFKLTMHHETRSLRAYALIVVKPSDGLKRVDDDRLPSHQNSATGSVVKAMTMKEWADYISSPLELPVVDKTGLPGRYDFVIDFTPYVSNDHAEGVRPDPVAILSMTMQGELGLKLEKEKADVDVLVVDHAERPGAN